MTWRNNMNLKYLVAILACFLVSVPLVGQDVSSAAAGVSVWSSYANVLNNFVPRPVAPLQSGTVSNLTLDRNVTVTRLQLHAAVGANNNFSFGTPCTILPAVKVTDGTHSVSLPIPNAPIVDGNLGAVSADSGPVHVEFPSPAKLSVVIVPGDNTSTAFCSATEVNVTVQYR